MTTLPLCPACVSAVQPFTVKQGYNVYRCGRCRTLFIFPLPRNEKLAALYAKEYFFGGGTCGGYVNYDEDKKAMADDFRGILAMLERSLGRRGRLLDVGAATGYFVELALRAGWDARGIEISKEAVAVARQKGLPVAQGTLASYAANTDAFDVVTLWDVIEHVPNPDADVTAAAQLLTAGGILALITPRADALWARLMGKRWHLLNPPEHLACYSRLGLSTLLQRHGFSIERIATPAKQFSLPYIAHIAANWLPWMPLRSLERLLARSFFRRLSFPLNFRDNMFVIAHKS